MLRADASLELVPVDEVEHGLATEPGRDPFGEAVLDFVDWDEFERRVGPEHSSVTLDHIDRSIAASIERSRAILGYAPRYSSLEALYESLRWLVDQGAVDVAGQSF